MKKPILVLLVLLFLLILSCVYQKTEVLYAKTNDNLPNTLPAITLKPLPAVKKEHKSTKSVTEVVQKPLIKQETSTTTQKVQLQAKVAVVENKIKITKSVTEAVPKPLIKQKITATTPVAPTPAKQKDIEEIDTLMQALKNREVAFKNRDAFELYIQRLIKQALDDRTIAISYMNNEELHLLELQKELIKARDHDYNQIGQTNNPTSGE